MWTAPSGLLALDVYRQQKDSISVALLDVRMPVMDGPQTLATACGESTPPSESVS